MKKQTVDDLNEEIRKLRQQVEIEKLKVELEILKQKLNIWKAFPVKKVWHRTKGIGSDWKGEI